jgi:predicted RNA binding protein YcfA (HicA-like mRNA interferase family)
MPRITPIHWRDLERVFLAAGFQFARQEGSHRSYIKPVEIGNVGSKTTY